MLYLPDKIKEIALTGASIVIDAKGILPDKAQEIVLAAKSAGGFVTILNAGRYHPDITKALVIAGGKNVAVYLTDSH